MARPSHMTSFAVGVLVFALAIVMVASSNSFAVGPAGSQFSTSPAPGYVLASLADIQSSPFLSVYNALGLNVETSAPFTLPSGSCPFFGIQGGYLAFGSPLDVVPTLLSPFGNGGTIQTGSMLSSPVWFGTSNPTAFATNNEFVGPLNATFLASLYILPESTLNALTLACNPSEAHVALYITAEFIIAPFGADFPSPPSSTAVLAALADIKSEVFLAAYNPSGLAVGGAATPHDICCAIRLQDGYVSFESSSLAPYTASESIQCPADSLAGPVWLGTANNGGYPGMYIGAFNVSVLVGLSVSPNTPSVCTSSQRDVWAIYKAHPGTGPAPSSGDCYDMAIRVSYYLPNGVICLADRWSFYMKLNETYETIAMSSLNECGGSIGAVSAFNMEIQPYAENKLVARTTGATSCNCQGGDVSLWTFVPTNYTGSMSTVCDLPVQEFYFCDVLINVNKGPVKCPPSP